MTTRARSHWGWGYADRFPDRDTRVGLGQMAAAHLGFNPGEVRDPVPAEAVKLPARRLDPPASLADVVDVTDRARLGHAYGRSWPDLFGGFSGDFACAPDAVALPRTDDDVVRVLDWASDVGAAVIPFGGGTSVVGGVDGRPAKAQGKPVIALALARMGALVDVIEESLLARVQAGALGPSLEAQLARSGLTLRFFPQSFEHSTLGGWIATRAGGHFATLYTHIDDLVASTTMVTPSGRMETRRLPGSGAGPDPNRLVLGSEGSFGVITEAWVRVRPRPVWRGRADVSFTDFVAAVTATRHIAQAGLYPSNCRLLDAREAALNQVSQDGAHVLLLAFESADHPVEELLRRAVRIAEGEGGRCARGLKLSERRPPQKAEKDEKEGRDGADAVWRQAFFDGPYLQSILLSLGVIADTFETACPWDRFAELEARVTGDVNAALREVCGAGSVSCRFTHVYPDGPAPYFTWIGPARPGGELEQWRTVKAAAMDAVVAAGGTITHHHAVGRVHVSGYEREVPAVYRRALSSVKAELDPKGIMNPGVLGLS